LTLKRILRALFLLVVLLVGFAAGLWAFFPWNQAAQVAFDGAVRNLNGRGIDLTALDVSGRGGLRPSVALIEGSLDPVRSLFARGVAVDLRLGSGTLQLLQGQSLGWQRGALALKAGAAAVEVADLDLTGDLTVKGGFLFDTGQGKLSQAALEIAVPPEADSLMTGLRALLPLRKESDGRWKVERP
jgi:hypothetical protein